MCSLFFVVVNFPAQCARISLVRYYHQVWEYQPAFFVRGPLVTAGVGYAGSRAHAPNEHIRIPDFSAQTRYIAALLEELAA